MSFAIESKGASPIQHWSAKPCSLTIRSLELKTIISTAMGVSIPDCDQTTAAIREQKAAIQQALSVLKGVEAERNRFQKDALVNPNARIADLEAAESEANLRLASWMDALVQAQSTLESAERERDAVKAKFSEVSVKLKTAAKGKRTELSEKKRMLQIETSTRFNACAGFRKAVDAAQAKVDQEKMRISRIRDEKEKVVNVRRDSDERSARIQERWNQAAEKVRELQEKLDAFIEEFVARNFADEPDDDRQNARYFLRSC